MNGISHYGRSDSSNSGAAPGARKRGWDEQMSSSPPRSGKGGKIGGGGGKGGGGPPSKRVMSGAHGSNTVNPEQLELLLLIVRATYCSHFPRLAAGVHALPTYLPYPLDISAGLPPKNDPMAHELSAATRAAFAERGFREMLAGVGESVLRVEEGGEGGREGGAGQVQVQVSTALLLKLRKILLLKVKEEAVRAVDALEEQVIERVCRSVRMAGTLLGANKPDYVQVLLNTPWDVIGFCRKSVLTRLTLFGEAVAKQPEEEKTRRLQLTVLVQRLALSSNGIWEKEMEKEMQRYVFGGGREGGKEGGREGEREGFICVSEGGEYGNKYARQGK